MCRKFLFLLTALLCIYECKAELRLSPLFKNGMVFQREQQIPIIGEANVRAEVVLHWGGRSYRTVSDDKGRWSIELPPQQINSISQKLRIESGTDRIEIDDILVGDVFLCSGQSNMAWMLKQSKDYKTERTCANSLVRYFLMDPIAPTSNVEWSAEQIRRIAKNEYFNYSGWLKSNDSEVDKFSAIAFTFANRLADSLNIPIGVVQNAIGGSTQESWIEYATLQNDPVLQRILIAPHDNQLIQDWARGRAAKNLAKAPVGSISHPFFPGYLYEAGMRPIQDYRFRGLLWYQGESNAHDPSFYTRLFTVFIQDIRRTLRNPNMPVLFAQLSSIDRPLWGEFRNEQRLLAQKIPHATMIVTSDVGDSLDVHPRQKRIVGERMMQRALASIYGKVSIPPVPECISAKKEHDRIVLTFNTPLKMATPIVGFEVAGADLQFFPATASIEVSSVTIVSPKVSVPMFVRYGWASFTRANLYDQNDSPVSTFAWKIE